MTTSVKRKERQARQEEIKWLKVTGNGNLPDEEVRSIRNWFQPRIIVPLLKKIIWVVGVTRGTTTGLLLIPITQKIFFNQNKTVSDHWLCFCDISFLLLNENNEIKISSHCKNSVKLSKKKNHCPSRQHNV